MQLRPKRALLAARAVVPETVAGTGEAAWRGVLVEVVVVVIVEVVVALSGPSHWAMEVTVQRAWRSRIPASREEKEEKEGMGTRLPCLHGVSQAWTLAAVAVVVEVRQVNHRLDRRAWQC